MIRFRDLRVRTRLALVLAAVLLPLLIGAGFTIGYLQSGLRAAADLELSNIVEHLYRLCELRHRARGRASADAAATPPRPADLAFLEQVILSTRVGKSGYAYIMGTRGTLVFHRTKKGRNIYDNRDSKGRAFIREICNNAVRLKPSAVGIIRYPWQNIEVGETSPRMKVVKYKYFAPWDWIVAVGAYEDEIYASVKPARWMILSLVVLSMVTAVLLTWVMSRLITRPVEAISQAAVRLAEGRPDPKEIPTAGNDELALLARSFNDMAGQIRRKKEELERLVEERTRELMGSEKRYQSLVENTIDCIVTADRAGTITFVNKGLEKLVGVDRDQIVGRKIWEYYRGGLEQARDIMARIRKEGAIRNYEQQLVTPDGFIPIMTSATMLQDAEGNDVGTLGIFSDITKVKKLEEKLARAQVDLARTNKMRALGDLVAGVAHEINNPLMASVTMVRVIEKGISDCDPKLLSQLEVVAKCNSRITKIVNHLREFSRQTELEKKEIDINLPLSNAILISSQQLMNMRIEIEQDLTNGLPTIFADANLLEQMFLDLFANARDAMEDIDGQKKLLVSSSASDLDGSPAVAVTVHDTGPGIPPDIQEKIFEPFFTTKPTGKGTGLGLPTCYGIVEEHGGRIDWESTTETGTRFTIRIPTLAATQGAIRGEEKKHESQSTSD